MSWSDFRDAKTRSQWRDSLLRQQGGRCALCGHRFPRPDELPKEHEAAWLATFDHIVPKSMGGDDSLANLRLVHGTCNHKRGDASDNRPLTPAPKVLRQSRA
jgi:5-methylcytosine-specific restriction endonuclease McrA